MLSNQIFLSKIFKEYQAVKRFGLRNDETIPIDFLLAIDEELDLMRIRDRERQEKLIEAQRAANQRRR